MNERCVINSAGKYQTYVEVQINEDGKEIPIGYTLKTGETLIDAISPVVKLHAEAEGFICQLWNGKEWTEGATPEEISAWNAEHPAPTPMPPTETEKLQEENRLLRAQVQAATERQDFVEDCIAEMAAQVYI